MPIAPDSKLPSLLTRTTATAPYFTALSLFLLSGGLSFTQQPESSCLQVNQTCHFSAQKQNKNKQAEDTPSTFLLYLVPALHQVCSAPRSTPSPGPALSVFSTLLAELDAFELSFFCEDPILPSLNFLQVCHLFIICETHK